MTGPQPLAGVRVLDLTRFVAGPYATMLLASMGADVVKVEAPGAGDPYRHQGTETVGDQSSLFLALNGGKRSMTLDLRHPAAAPVLERLVDWADVVIQNARPGSLDAYGLGWDAVHERNPRCIYASISGYGDTGPESAKGGFDLVMQADAGVMSVTGLPDGQPVAIGAPLLDIGSGVSCLVGILAALIDRQTTGEGRRVSASLLEFSLAGLTTLAAAYLAGGRVPQRSGAHSPLFAPYGAFHTADGWIVLAGAGSEHLWVALCETIGAPELALDERFATNADRVRHRDELVDEVEARLAGEPTPVWVERLEAAGVPASVPRGIDELLASDQVAALGTVHDLDHPTAGPYRVVGAPFRLEAEALAPSGPAPMLGVDTGDVLAELGFDDAMVRQLADDAVVAL